MKILVKRSFLIVILSFMIITVSQFFLFSDSNLMFVAYLLLLNIITFNLMNLRDFQPLFSLTKV